MKRVTHLVILTAALLMVFTACGGSGTEEGGAANSGSGTTDPDQLAEEIVSRYMECMDELKSMVEDRPEPDVLKPQLENLVDRYSGVFLEIGYRVDENDSSTVDDIGRAVMNELYRYDIQWLSEASSHYHSMDTELSALLSEVNIITQYAFFELLEDQRPEEAERLGVAD
ncbi:MAG: hypothetical protein R6U39_10410 [Candidatus Aegiribacteria sp.]